MSLLNDITAVVGNRSPYGANGQQPTLGTGQQPGAPSAASQVASRFGTVFQTEFSSTFTDVYQRGASGEFDDRTLALEEQAALQRLRVAQEAAKPVGTGGVPGTGTGTGTGTGDAAGAGTGIGGDVPGDVTGGGETGEIRGSNAAPDATSIAVSEQRELYAVRVRQSEARLKNISASLATDFPLATQLVSASTGSWDPDTFVPQTRQQAEALAHRLVIDATEAAARLEIIKTQLSAAKFELSQGAGADVQKLVADLEAAYGRQSAYVEKLAKVVDRQSDGQVTEAGEDALAGGSMRDSGDMPVDEIVANLRAEGTSEEDIKVIVGAMELAVEQEKTPGGSSRLKDMARVILNNYMMMDSLRDSSEKDREMWRESDRKYEENRIEEERIEKVRSERVASDTAAETRQARLDAEFRNWLEQLSAQQAQQRQAG